MRGFLQGVVTTVAFFSFSYMAQVHRVDLATYFSPSRSLCVARSSFRPSFSFLRDPSLCELMGL